MKIGLYFGSFNPIHIGHLIIANSVLNETEIDRLWFVISPQNPLKKTNTLLNEYHRLHLVRLAIQDNPRMKVTDIEFSLPRPSFTVNTMAYLTEKYPENNFSIIMGADSFQNLNKWKNFENIIQNYPICVYKRNGFEIKNRFNAKLTILDSPLIEISATQIRKLIKIGRASCRERV